MTTAAAAKPALLEQHTAPDKRIDHIPLALLTPDDSTQLRVTTDADAIARYAEIYEAKGADELPPIVVFECDEPETEPRYYIGDGFHRVAAARQAGIGKIPALVKPGGKRAAILYGLTANDLHGVRLTNADKRKAVQVLLTDAEWSRWSDRHIATLSRVSKSFVSTLRGVIEAQSDKPRKRVGKDGVERDVSKIGKGRKTKEASLGAFTPVYAANDLQAIEFLSDEIARRVAFLKGEPAIKRRILAALLLANRGLLQADGIAYRDRDGHGLTRAELEQIIDAKLDVHAGQLRRKGRIHFDSADSLIIIDEDLSEDLFPCLSILSGFGPGVPPKEQIQFSGLDRPTDQASDLGDAIDHGASGSEITAAGTEPTTLGPNGETWNAAGVAESCESIVLKLPKSTKLEVTLSVAERPSHHWSYGFKLISGTTQSSAMPMLHGTAYPTRALALWEAVQVAVQFAREQGCSDKTIDAIHDQARGFLGSTTADDRTRLLDEQTVTCLVNELFTGKPRWRGHDGQRLHLAVVIGVETDHDVTWTNSEPEYAAARFDELLAESCASALQDDRRPRLPHLPQLCQLWGIDHAALHARATAILGL